MTSHPTFDAVGLAGGGNRCYWQSGFLKAFSEHQPLNPRFYVAVSASAYHGAMHLAGVGERVRASAFAFAEKGHRGVDWRALRRRESPLVVGALFRQLLADAFGEQELATLKAAPPMLIQLSGLPDWMPGALGALGSIGAYQDRQEAELRRQTAGTGIEVTRDGDVIKLNLPDGVTFDFGKADLKSQFYPALNNVAATLREYNQTIVEVSGHTDSIGSDAVNQRLSEQRAAAVKDHLVTTGRLDGSKIVAEGRGETQPVTKPEDCQGQQRTPALVACLQPDRRVEVEVTGTR